MFCFVLPMAVKFCCSTSSLIVIASFLYLCTHTGNLQWCSLFSLVFIPLSQCPSYYTYLICKSSIICSLCSESRQLVFCGYIYIFFLFLLKKKVICILVEIVWSLCIAVGPMLILIILNLLICEHRISFHVFMSYIINFIFIL